MHDARARLLRSYEIDLDGLAEWDERWLAHVDGLLIGGSCSRPIVEKGLHEDHEGTVCAAAAVHACWGGEADRERLESVLRDPEFKHFVPLAFGLGLAPSALHERWLDGWIRSQEARLRATAAEIMRFRGVAPSSEILRPLFRLDQQPSEVVRAALELVADLKVPGCNACIEGALESPDASLKRAALEAMVKLGFRGARERWRATVRQAGGRALPEDIEKLGVYGSPDDLQLLLRAFETPNLTAAALRGLGWLGHAGAAELLLVSMSNAELGQLAGHAFSMLFGVNLEAEKLSLPAGGNGPASTAGSPEPGSGQAATGSTPNGTPEDDEASDLGLYSALPRPAPNAVAAWWKKHASRFPSGSRWRFGRPHDASAAAKVLRTGLLADRPNAALELGLSLKEAPFVEPRALAAEQHRVLDSAMRPLQRGATGTHGRS